MKVSSALAGQIMIMYHHCAVPDPLRAASWPPRLRDGIGKGGYGCAKQMHIAAPNVHNYFGAQALRDGRGRSSLPCALACCWHTWYGPVHAACQDLVHRHWRFTFQRVWHFGSLPGPTQLPRWLRLAFKGPLSSGLGTLHGVKSGRFSLLRCRRPRSLRPRAPR